MKTKKLLSILMALMMILSVVPFYASAEAIALTADNVVVWPTTSGEIWFGQKLSDGIVLHAENALVTSDGTENGTVIPGKWEFVGGDYVPTSAGASTRANIMFTPDDTTAYTGFEVSKSRDVTFVVNKVDPVFVDEINDPVVATDVEQGATLSTSTLSGGQMKNPYTNEVITGKSWSWALKTTVVNSTGEYNITFAGGTGYNRVNSTVLVKVIGTMQETEIIQAPQTAVVEYSPTATFGDVPIEGAKAVIKGTDVEIKGTFSTSWADVKVGNVGNKEIPITFTPDDTENYIASEGKMSVTITKANYKFVNENGEEIVPELTLPYGTTFDINGRLGVTLKSMIKDRSALSGADVAYINFPDHDRDELAPVGTNTYTVRIYPSHEGNSNYQTTYRQFVLTIEPVTVDVKITTNVGAEERSLKIETVDSNAPYPKGTFDVYVDGALYMEDVKGSFPFDPGKSGQYEIRLVYNPVENDPCLVPELTKTVTETYHRKLNKSDNIQGGRTNIMYGDEVTLTANVVEESFGGWKITDADGNEITLEGAVIDGRSLTFTMPDFDITVEAIDKSTASGGNGGLGDLFGDLDLGDLTQGDSDNPIENLFNNIIALFKNIIEKITAFFRGIGDRT